MRLPRKEGVVCGLCGDRLFSFGVHDFHPCRCGGTFVDGGDAYMRSGFPQGSGPPRRCRLTRGDSRRIAGSPQAPLFKAWSRARGAL